MKEHYTKQLVQQERALSPAVVWGQSISRSMDERRKNALLSNATLERMVDDTLAVFITKDKSSSLVCVLLSIIPFGQ